MVELYTQKHYLYCTVVHSQEYRVREIIYRVWSEGVPLDYTPGNADPIWLMFVLISFLSLQLLPLQSCSTVSRCSSLTHCVSAPEGISSCWQPKIVRHRNTPRLNTFLLNRALIHSCSAKSCTMQS